MKTLKLTLILTLLYNSLFTQEENPRSKQNFEISLNLSQQQYPNFFGPRVSYHFRLKEKHFIFPMASYNWTLKRKEGMLTKHNSYSINYGYRKYFPNKHHAAYYSIGVGYCRFGNLDEIWSTPASGPFYRKTFSDCLIIPMQVKLLLGKEQSRKNLSIGAHLELSKHSVFGVNIGIMFGGK